MRENNGRFLQKVGTQDIGFSGDCLFIGQRAIIEKQGMRFVPLAVGALSEVFGLQAAHDGTRERLDKVARLLDEGRQCEAIIVASITNWKTSPDADKSKPGTSKANFNPFEARDSHGAWTQDGNQSDRTSPIVDVQYRGHFHDIVVDDLLKGLESRGSLAFKNIHILGIN